VLIDLNEHAASPPLWRFGPSEGRTGTGETIQVSITY